LSLDLEAPQELRGPVEAALDAAGVADGHLAVEIVGEERIRELNREHRGKDEPTDVLAFPVDEAGPSAGPRELGDVAICPECCSDVTEAAVHGVLHLCGFDHETDDGEMLRLQDEILRHIDDAAPYMTRAGFIGLAGRPNVGKSTLVNAIVGSRVAIVSFRPQTTRRAIRGIATEVDAGRQLVLVDLPGVQKPRDVLTERMQHRVERELADSDLALLVVNGEEGIGPGDRFIARALLGADAAIPTICVVNKADKVGPNELVPVLAEAAELEGVDEVFPLSARSGEGLAALVARLGELIPEGPFLYPPEDHSDQSSELLLAELIREQVLNRTRDEIPHSVEVSVAAIEPPREDGLVFVRAEVWAETESQKRILIGKAGAKVTEIGTAARSSLEAELGARVHLDLKVRVRRSWRKDEDMLDRLGIE
jgi:GTP-binding protein Era